MFTEENMTEIAQGEKQEERCEELIHQEKEDPFDSIVLQGEEIENISDYYDILIEDNDITQQITQGDCLNSDFFDNIFSGKNTTTHENNDFCNYSPQKI